MVASLFTAALVQVCLCRKTFDVCVCVEKSLGIQTSQNIIDVNAYLLIDVNAYLLISDSNFMCHYLINLQRQRGVFFSRW